jgi:hypothetical protein
VVDRSFFDPDAAIHVRADWKCSGRAAGAEPAVLPGEDADDPPTEEPGDEDEEPDEPDEAEPPPPLPPVDPPEPLEAPLVPVTDPTALFTAVVTVLTGPEPPPDPDPPPDPLVVVGGAGSFGVGGGDTGSGTVVVGSVGTGSGVLTVVTPGIGTGSASATPAATPSAASTVRIPTSRIFEQLPGPGFGCAPGP